MDTRAAMQRQPEKCTFVGCENMGIPQEGFDFFMCDSCANDLEKALEAEGKRVYGRHENN